MGPLWIRNGRYAVEPRKQTWTKRLIFAGLVVALGLVVFAANATGPVVAAVAYRAAQTFAVLVGLGVVYFLALVSSESRRG